MEIYKVEVEDLSHLGGPMGSGYVTPMGSHVFGTPEAVYKFITEREGGYDKPGVLERIQTLKVGGCCALDCRSIGYDITKVKVEE